MQYFMKPVKKNKHLIAARFELAPPKRLVPKTSALDHSATLPVLPNHGTICNSFVYDLHVHFGQLAFDDIIHAAIGRLKGMRFVY